jgi:hypothetical protein
MRLYHKRLAEFEMYDEIRLVMEERWKESELSGSEYRYSCGIQLFFKGILVKTEGARDMNAAIMLLGWYKLCGKDPYAGIPIEVQDQEKLCCDNIHCANPATKWFTLKRETSARGEWLEKEDGASVSYRQFCDRHAHRGDCSREDADDNYTAIPKPE